MTPQPLLSNRLGMRSWLAGTLLACAALPAWSQASPEQCGGLANGYGPFDYRNQKQQIQIVEKHHFAPHVENLVRGQEGSIGGDLDYVLRAVPNHHRALVAMMRYADRMKTDRPADANYIVECYFERAVRFRPEDTSARMLFATFLHRKNRLPEAQQQMKRVVELAADDPFVHYNAGLVYLEMKEFDLALARAHAADALGLKRPGLREQLTAAGKWRDPSPPAAAGDAAAPAASAPPANAASQPAPAASARAPG